MTIWLRMFAVALVLLAGTVRAELTIEITQGMDKAVRIAIVPFGGQERVPDRTDLAKVISDDLQRSGQFVALDRNAMLGFPTRAEEVHFRDWKVLGIEYVVIGDMQLMADGRLELVWSLFDVVREERMRMETLRAPGSSARDLAHLVSDSVYERLTGIPGAFSTRIMYVLVENPGARNARYRLEIADADGARPRTLLSSPEPILSAVWSPDGRQVAYVSFEAGQPSIVLQELATGAREVLTRFDGLNSAPAWSPDGRRMALVLSRDGNPELYLMDLQTRALTRLTRHYGIDTEPSWTPDGRSLVFTSNRGGGPQIYRMDVATGETQRLTFEGDYNARGRMLPDGRHLIYVHRKDGLFHMALLELERDRQLLLTQANLDESPSVAPNGSMVIYATQQRGRGILAVVSIDGRVKYELPSTDGDVREPAWSPFLK